MQIWTSNGSESQQVELVPIKDGSYAIKTRITNGKKGVDVCGNSTVAGDKTYENNYTYEDDKLKTITHNRYNKLHIHMAKWKTASRNNRCRTRISNNI